MTTTAVVTAAVAVPKMQHVRCSAHNAMYILLYTRNVVAVADAPNEVPGMNIVGIIRTMIYEYIQKEHTCFAYHNTWLAGPAVGLRT